MTKTMTIAGLGLSLLLFALVRANAAGAPQAKVGYVDLQRTLNETKVGRAAKERLETEKKKRQKDIDDKKTALEKDAAELEKQRVVLKPEAAKAKEKELQDKYVTLQNTFMQLQQELTKKEAELTREIFGKASKIIESVAKRDGYTIMLEKSESAVLYADPSTEITAEVNRRLDAGEGT